MSEFETLTLQCQDGYRLSARFYAAISETEKLPVLVCPELALPNSFIISSASGYKLKAMR